ncbi:alpha-ketoacid dehydrogenase subunit beta [Actinocorallia aurantiaca]|uniref:Alpha-ketoacid dehydrogenase subunit beta n=1 Tax=Actinocorallia aurantiaca TaxID=46204 RepID=A0ABP6GQ21_9ACTN
MRVLSFADAINEAIQLEMARDPRVLVTGEDVAGGATIPGFDRADAWGGVFGVTRGLVTEFGRDRVIDTPISESAFIGAAIGAATSGYRTVTELQFLDFMGVCLDQIINQAAKLHYARGSDSAGIPIVIRSMIGAGSRAGSTQSQSHYSTVAHFPGLKVVAPATPADAKGLMISAIRDQDPVFFLENKALYETRGPVPEGDYTVPIGRANVVREGRDVTVVTIARMLSVAEKAVAELAGRGIEAELIDLRTIAPLDLPTILESVGRTGRLVVVDEDTPRCSVASDIVGLVSSRAFDKLKAAPRMVTSPHTPVPFAPVLEDAFIPAANDVVQAVLATVGQEVAV